MAFVERGKIQDGNILFSKPLSLPEGTEVIIHIEPINTARQSLASNERKNFVALPFFGMWAERKDMSDSALWVRKERCGSRIKQITRMKGKGKMRG